MIKKYPLNTKISRYQLLKSFVNLGGSTSLRNGKIKSYLEHPRHFLNETWVQSRYGGTYDQPTRYQNDCRDNILTIISQLTGIRSSKLDNPILHFFNDDIPSHTDGMSKKVVVLPVSISKGCILYDEDNEFLLDTEHYYLLNDHLEHGIYLGRKSQNYLITVDTK